MTKHLADHRSISDGGRLQHFLRIERGRSPAAARALHQRPHMQNDDNRRTQEFLRIERSASDAE